MNDATSFASGVWAAVLADALSGKATNVQVNVTAAKRTISTVFFIMSPPLIG